MNNSAMLIRLGNTSVYSVCRWVVVVLIFPYRTFAQTDAIPDTTAFSHNSIFLELLGNAGLYSLNYEHRFVEQFGLRIGFSRVNFPLDVETGPTTVAPLMINHIRGKGNHHLELGLGALLSNDDESRGLTATIGYRFQPPQGGYHFHIGFTPLITTGFMPWGGAGFGISF